MSGYQIVSLKEMIDELGEDEVRGILSDFSCPMNLDVEKYIRSTAITLAKQGVAQTHLVFTDYKKEKVLIGYFTLAIKYITIPSKNSLSSNMRKRIRRFARENKETKTYFIPAPLIAQLGKNFTNNYNKLITGDELLKFACDKVQWVQKEVGGKIVYLECEDKPKLIDFYTSNGFIDFSCRELDPNEKTLFEGKRLIQMLKYLG